MKKIYCFGNPYLTEDSYALELADELGKDKSLNKNARLNKINNLSKENMTKENKSEENKITKKLNNNFEFIKCTSPNFLLDINEKEIIIIDVVKGINKVEIINDINKLKETKTSTMHDFDLCTVLKLLKETGNLKNVTIIGVPQPAISQNSSKNINDNKINNNMNDKSIEKIENKRINNKENIKKEIVTYLSSLT